MLGNDSTAQVLRRGWVDLKMTSRKILMLYEVLYAPNIRGNLISGSLFVSRGYKIML